MSMNIIAILISLAMMLTGVGGEGQPAEASRMLIVHSLSVTYNDETVDVDPALWLGVSSDGEKAVFDLGVQMDGDTLFPTQIGVDESGITALFKGSDLAAKISSKAFDSLSEQLGGMMEAAQAQMAEGENSELMNYIMNEYLPAYTGMLEAIQDPEYMKQMQAKANEIALSILDRGEGTPVTETYEDQEYALTEYHYTVESDKMAELIDAIYASDEKLAAYYGAMFKMYDMMPAESGLNGITSFKDMFEKTNLSMTMEITEKVSDDGEVDFTDATLTMDLNAMVQSMAAAQADETASSDVPELAPLVMNIVGNKVGEHQDAVVSCTYEIEGVTMNMVLSAITEGENEAHMLMSIGVMGEDNETGSFIFGMDTTKDEATGDGNYFASLVANTPRNEVSFSASGICREDGSSENSFSFSVNDNGTNFALSFSADVMNGQLSDEANGHEAVVTLDDFSQETLSALGEDQAVQAALMQVVGSMSADSQKLMSNESVQKLIALFGSMNAQPAVIEDAEVEDTEIADEGEVEGYDEYQEPEDDGELGFNVPEFTWLPEGWELKETEMDTQYDWVSINAATEDYNNTMYATFYKDYDENTVNYVVGGDGEIEAVDGREITVSDFGDGNMSVTIHEGGVYGNLMFFSEDIDVETIGQIAAGIQF